MSRLKNAAAVNEISETVEARDIPDMFGYMELKRIKDSDAMWVTSRQVETTSCFNCGHAVLQAVDDDGTPRLVEPME